MFQIGDILVCVDNYDTPCDFLKVGEKYTVSQAHEYDTDHVYLNGSEIGWVAKRFVLVESTPEQKATQEFNDAMKAAWEEPRSHAVKILPQSFDYRQAYEKSTEVIDSLINIIAARPCYDVTLHFADADKMEEDCDTCEYEHLPYDDCKECITDWLDNGEKGSTGYKAKAERNCKDCFFSNFPAVMTAVNSPCLTCQPGVRPSWRAKVANSPSKTPPTAQEPVKSKVESRPIKLCCTCDIISLHDPVCDKCMQDFAEGYGHTLWMPKDDGVELEPSEARKIYDNWVARRSCLACVNEEAQKDKPPCMKCWNTKGETFGCRSNFVAKPFTE